MHRTPVSSPETPSSSSFSSSSATRTPLSSADSIEFVLDSPTAQLPPWLIFPRSKAAQSNLAPSTPPSLSSTPGSSSSGSSRATELGTGPTEEKGKELTRPAETIWQPAKKSPVRIRTRSSPNCSPNPQRVVKAESADALDGRRPSIPRMMAGKLVPALDPTQQASVNHSTRVASGMVGAPTRADSLPAHVGLGFALADIPPFAGGGPSHPQSTHPPPPEAPSALSRQTPDQVRIQALEQRLLRTEEALYMAQQSHDAQMHDLSRHLHALFAELQHSQAEAAHWRKEADWRWHEVARRVAVVESEWGEERELRGRGRLAGEEHRIKVGSAPPTPMTIDPAARRPATRYGPPHRRQAHTPPPVQTWKRKGSIA